MSRSLGNLTGFRKRSYQMPRREPLSLQYLPGLLGQQPSKDSESSGFVFNDLWPLFKGFKGHPLNNLPETPAWHPATDQVELVESAICPSENADCTCPCASTLLSFSVIPEGLPSAA